MEITPKNIFCIKTPNFLRLLFNFKPTMKILLFVLLAAIAISSAEITLLFIGDNINDVAKVTNKSYLLSLHQSYYNHKRETLLYPLGWIHDESLRMIIEAYVHKGDKNVAFVHWGENGDGVEKFLTTLAP